MFTLSQIGKSWADDMSADANFKQLLLGAGKIRVTQKDSLKNEVVWCYLFNLMTANAFIAAFVIAIAPLFSHAQTERMATSVDSEPFMVAERQQGLSPTQPRALEQAAAGVPTRSECSMVTCATDPSVRWVPIPGWMFTPVGALTCAGLIAAAGLAGWGALVRYKRIQNRIRLAARNCERARIARELHDSLLQSFQAQLFTLQAVSNLMGTDHDAAARLLEKSLGRCEDALEEARDAIQQLRGMTAVTVGLVEQLNALGDELGERTGPSRGPVFRVVNGGLSRKFDALMQDDIYCIAREAVRNASQHGRANHIEVRLVDEANALRLSVVDDGIGVLMPSERAEKAGHWGIQGMRERAATFGAVVTLRANEDCGTIVELYVPSASFDLRLRSPTDEGHRPTRGAYCNPLKPEPHVQTDSA